MLKRAKKGGRKNFFHDEGYVELGFALVVVVVVVFFFYLSIKLERFPI